MVTRTAVVERLRLYVQNSRTRRALRHQVQQMNAEELGRLASDIGVSSTDLHEEASRPFWVTSKPKEIVKVQPERAGLSLRCAPVTGEA